MKIFLSLVVLMLTGCASQWPDVTLKGPAYFVTAGTGSMKPHYKGGERLRVVPMKWEEIKPGMICVYWNRQMNRETTVVHRVMFKNGNRCVMKGDNNFSNDPGYMTPLDYVGTVVEETKAQ